MKKQISSNQWLLLTLIAVYLLGMFFFSYYTSPLYPDCLGYDSALFSLIGKGITEGKVVYQDLFDHKGPILFFIEALGYFVSGRTGIFLMQCVSGIANLCFLYGAWRAIKEKQGQKNLADLLFVFVSFWSILSFTMEGGNLSEEYSLPFISLCLFLFVKYALKCRKSPRHPLLYAFFYGVSAMALVLIRLNNSITVLVGIFAIFLYLLYRKQFGNLLLNLLFGVLGILVVAFPIFLYFASKNALPEMLYGTFTYNFSYADGTGQVIIDDQNYLKYLVLYAPMICSAVLILAKIVKSKKFIFFDFLASLMLVGNAVILILSNRYPHYFTIFIPVFSVILSAYVKPNFMNLKTLLVVICVVMHFLNAEYVITQTCYQNFTLNFYEKKAQIVSEIVTRIPEDERNSVIGYEISSDVYLYAGITPDFKYYTMQNWWSENDSAIMEDFLEYLDSGKATWVMVVPFEDDPSVMDILAEKYQYVDNCTYAVLYRLKEPLE